MGTMSSTQNMADDDDSDSEDSMAKIERQYQQLALSKTNTIPVGYVIGYVLYMFQMIGHNNSIPTMKFWTGIPEIFVRSH